MYPQGSVCLSIPRAEFNRLCSLFATQLQLQDSGCTLDPVRLLIALGGRESSFGANLKPRHEPSYDAGGRYYRGSQELQRYIARYGSSGACSYGPLQVMAFNALGCTPGELARDPETAMGAAVSYFNRYVLHHWRARTLEEICACWNAGSPHGTPLAGYVEDVTKYYAEAVR